MPPIDKYGQRPPIAYPDKEWCGEHTFVEGPAVRVNGDLPMYAVTEPPTEAVASLRVADLSDMLDADPPPMSLPLSSPPAPSPKRPKK